MPGWRNGREERLRLTLLALGKSNRGLKDGEAIQRAGTRHSGQVVATFHLGNSNLKTNPLAYRIKYAVLF